MAITHSTATRDAAANAILARINVGTPASSGSLVFLDAANVVCASLPMSPTAFGNSSGGTAVANPITTATGVPGGNTTKFNIIDRSGVTVLSGSVGTSGADINLSSTNIGVGDTVSVSSLSYTAMP